MKANTKFWITIIGMLCVTGIVVLLIIREQYQFVNTYFIIMGTAMGIYSVAKAFQNASIGRNGNGGQV